MEISAKAILARWRIFFVLGILLIAGGVRAWDFTHNRGYQPDQPIAFSHRVHAGQLGMDCLYCHTNATVSKYASVPPVDTCMGCHLVIATDSPEIQKLTEYWENNEAIPWVRIHSLPDHAYFNHAAHVSAGVACQECHGPIQEMEIVKQWVDLSMGWCIECHRNDEYLRTPEREAIIRDQNQFAHSFYHLGQPGRVDTAALAERYRSVRGEIWNADDINRLTSQRTEREVAQILHDALGYFSWAPQQGRARVHDHVAAFQNANISCNTCHY